MLSSLPSWPLHRIVSLRELDQRVPALRRAPKVTRILAENIVRSARTAPEPERAGAIDAATGVVSDLCAAVTGGREVEFAFRPTRLLLQDHSGVPVLADLAALRSLVDSAGRDVRVVQPALPVDLVVDHSVEAHFSGNPQALDGNMSREYSLNAERYRFLRWAQSAIDGLRVVPPGGGIVHQIHLEHLAHVVMPDGAGILAPDTVLGTDSHTPMINGLGVLGWGVGGVEASSVMFGHPVSIRSQPVLGIRLTGSLRPGVLATDLALSLTEVLRRRGVVGMFCEFTGPGVRSLSVEDRATVANMAPEYGCLTAYFPIDAAVVDYLAATGRPAESVALVAEYAEYQGLLAENDPGSTPVYSDLLTFDLGAVQTSVSGPRRPQERLSLSEVPASFPRSSPGADGAAAGNDGAVVIAAITSCTNTANPRLVVTAGLLARNAVAAGLSVQPWTKTTFAPGSRRVTDYLEAVGLLEPLSALGFDVAGYGCTTCIGNSGPLTPAAQAWPAGSAATAAVLSGNRNFEGRIHSAVDGAYLMSPAMVVVYALAGNVLRDLGREPVGHDRAGRPVHLGDLWPGEDEVREVLAAARDSVRDTGHDVFRGDARWRALDTPVGSCYDWPQGSSYLKPSPFVSAASSGLADIDGARVLVFAPDSTTTDHISPAGRIALHSDAARYLTEQGVASAEYNSYGCRRGNHDVLVRGTFANTKFRNRIADGSGARTTLFPDGAPMSVHEAAQQYSARDTPVIVLGGRDYGMGSSRDWAAKGPRLLGVRAVLAKSFERIHRSNLIGVGIVPLQFQDDEDADTLGLVGDESFTVTGLESAMPGSDVTVCAVKEGSGSPTRWRMRVRIDTAAEWETVRRGGFLSMLAQEAVRAIPTARSDT
jgi:aconitate hydratase